MECHGDDLCTLQELSDSNILSCLEDRYKRGILQAFVGPNVSLFLSANGVQSQVDSLASSIILDLCTLSEDQCVLMYGSIDSGKCLIFNNLVGSLVRQLTPSQVGLTNVRLLEGIKLLSLLTGCQGNRQCIVATSMCVAPNNTELYGGHFSCLLLNTATLDRFDVVCSSDTMTMCEERLEQLGITLPIRDNYVAIVKAIKYLISEQPQEAGQCIGVNLDGTLPTRLLAQQLYAYLLRWTVLWLNSELCPTPTKSYNRILCVDHPGTWTDIQHSSLSDLVSRYSSEYMHNLYCHRLFLWEQDQYVDEGIEWDTVQVDFNQPLMNAFHKSSGLLFSAGQSTSALISSAIVACCEDSGESCYETDSDTFVVNHFTGEQSYVVTDDWPSINSAHCVSHDLVALLKTSTNYVIQEMTESMSTCTPDVLPIDHTPSDSTPLLTARAKIGLSSLSEAITVCNPHFVLCMDTVSNERSKETKFDPAHVLTQLQYLRVLDTALIQSCGYPVRMSHNQFVTMYSSLLINRDTSLAARDTCVALFETAKLEDGQIGATQVLLKPWHVHQLGDALSLLQTSSIKLQQACRRSFTRQHSDKQKMEKALSELTQSTIFEDSEDDDIVFPTPGNGPPSDKTVGEMTTCPIPPTSVTEPTCSIPPNSPASQPHPSHSAQPHLCTPTHMSPSLASPASPKSPAKSGSGAKKRSWGKDVRTQSTSPPPSHSTSHTRTPSTGHTSHVWYHGRISRGDAEKVLKSVTFECFLIRESQNRPGDFSLSVKHRGKVKHFRIDTKEGTRRRFELFGAKRSFLHLIDMVEYYSQHCISAEGELLTVPCPIEGSPVDCPPPLPPPRRTNLSSIRRPQQSIRKLHNRPRQGQRSSMVSKGSTHPPLGHTRPHSLDLYTADISDESVSLVQKELDIEERIVEAARRLSDMPSGNKKERQRRRQSLAEARSRLLTLRQQYHTLQERRRFIELSMQNVSTSSNRRVSSPLPPTPPPRHGNK